MEANWLKFLCPTCLTDEGRITLSAKGASAREKFGSWLKFLCPTCLTDEDRIALSAKGASAREKFGSWLRFLCPTCLAAEDHIREDSLLTQAFMSSGNCL